MYVRPIFSPLSCGGHLLLTYRRPLALSWMGTRKVPPKYDVGTVAFMDDVAASRENEIVVLGRTISSTLCIRALHNPK